MAEISNNGLFCLKNIIDNFHCIGESAKDIKCIVLSIGRYTSEPPVPDGKDNSHDLYDIVLHDGKSKQRFALKDDLNYMVKSNKLHVGCLVLINPSDCDIRYEESNLRSSYVLLLGRLTVLGMESTTLVTDLCGTEPTQRPILTGRGCYLSLLCNEDPFGDIWYDYEADVDRVKVNYNTLGSVSSLSEHWKSVSRKDYLPLLVRVLHRSRLRYYGKPNRSAKWPYQAFFEVADQSGTCRLVLWNDMCPKLYSRLSEGTLLYIQGFTVKRCFEQMSRARVRDPDLKVHSVELGVNSSCPKAEVRVLKASQVPTRDLPPSLTYHFLSRQQLSSVPDGYNVDIVGVVLYIGRCQRLKGKDGFWVYRWLELLDGSSPRVIRVELFATSQPDTHRQLDIGQVLVATQMRVVHGVESVTRSRQSSPRTLYVTTTNESQIYVHSAENFKGPYSRDASVIRVQQWSQSEAVLQVIREKGSVGGYYDYPRLPTSLDEYLDNYKGKDELKILSADELEHQINELEFLEFRRVHMQGFIAGVSVQVDGARTRDNNNMGISSEEDSDSEVSVTGHSLRSGKETRRKKAAVKRAKSSANSNKRKRKRKEASLGWKETQGEEQHVVLRDIMHSCSIPTVGEPFPSLVHKRRYRAGSTEDRRLLDLYVHTPPQVYTPEIYTENRTMEDLGRLSDAEPLSVTLTGLHHNIRVHSTTFLPPHCPPDSTLTDLLCGQLSGQTGPASTSQQASGQTQSASTSQQTGGQTQASYSNQRSSGQSQSRPTDRNTTVQSQSGSIGPKRNLRSRSASRDEETNVQSVSSGKETNVQLSSRSPAQGRNQQSRSHSRKKETDIQSLSALTGHGRNLRSRSRSIDEETYVKSRTVSTDPGRILHSRSHSKDQESSVQAQTGGNGQERNVRSRSCSSEGQRSAGSSCEERMETSGPSGVIGQDVATDVQGIVGTVRELEQKRMLFVLDLFSYGENRTEITLNRGYLVPD